MVRSPHTFGSIVYMGLVILWLYFESVSPWCLLRSLVYWLLRCQVTWPTHEQVQHDLLARRAVAFVQAVGGADEPRYTVSRNLHQLHERPRASPWRLLIRTHTKPLGEPQVHGEQRAERHADDGRVEVHTVLFRYLLRAAGRWRRGGRGSGAPASPARALRGTEPRCCGVRALPLEKVRRRGRRKWRRPSQRHKLVATAAATHGTGNAATARAAGSDRLRGWHCPQICRFKSLFLLTDPFNTAKVPVHRFTINTCTRVHPYHGRPPSLKTAQQP